MFHVWATADYSAAIISRGENQGAISTPLLHHFVSFSLRRAGEIAHKTVQTNNTDWSLFVDGLRNSKRKSQTTRIVVVVVVVESDVSHFSPAISAGCI